MASGGKSGGGGDVTAVHHFPAELHNNGTMWWPNIEIRYISLLLFTVARILSHRTADDTNVDVDSWVIQREKDREREIGGPLANIGCDVTRLTQNWCDGGWWWWKKIDICHIWFRICIFIANRLCFTDVNHFSAATTTRAFLCPTHRESLLGPLCRPLSDCPSSTRSSSGEKEEYKLWIKWI